MTGRTRWAVWAAAPILAAAAPPGTPFSLDCYLTQSGSLALGQFVRHLDVRPERGVVVIADGVRGRAPRFVGEGQIAALDAAHLVYVYRTSASSGRASVDRASGKFVYEDGRRVVRGQCEASAP